MLFNNITFPHVYNFFVGATAHVCSNRRGSHPLAGGAIFPAGAEGPRRISAEAHSFQTCCWTKHPLRQPQLLDFSVMYTLPAARPNDCSGPVKQVLLVSPCSHGASQRSRKSPRVMPVGNGRTEMPVSAGCKRDPGSHALGHSAWAPGCSAV